MASNLEAATCQTSKIGQGWLHKFVEVIWKNPRILAEGQYPLLVRRPAKKLKIEAPVRVVPDFRGLKLAENP